MTDVPGAVLVANTLKPLNGQTYAVALQEDIAGGYQTFVTTGERDAFDFRKLVRDMKCYVRTGDKEYRLTSISPLVWTEIVSGGGSGGSVETVDGVSPDVNGNVQLDAVDASEAATIANNAISNAVSNLVIVGGNDGRLFDDRNPTPHNSTHYQGAIDEIFPSDIGAASVEELAEVQENVNVVDIGLFGVKPETTNAFDVYLTAGDGIDGAGTSVRIATGDVIVTVSVSSAGIHRRVVVRNVSGSPITVTATAGMDWRTPATTTVLPNKSVTLDLHSTTAATAGVVAYLLDYDNARGLKVHASNSFAISFADAAQQSRDATGAVTITGLTGLAAGLSVRVTLRNTTASDIPVSFVPTISGWANGAEPRVLVANGEATIDLDVGVGATVVDVVGTWTAPPLSRRMIDVWSTRHCGVGTSVAEQEFSIGATGGGTFLSDTLGLTEVWTARCNAASNNSGFGWRSTAQNVPSRGSLMLRSRIAIRSSSVDIRTIVGLIDGPGTTGYGFFFTGLDAKARLGNGTIEETSTFALTVDTFYVFEVEVDASHSSVTYRILDGNTEALLWSATLSTRMPTLGTLLVLYFAQGIFVTSPLAITAVLSVSDLAYGTRPGYDAWRGAA